MNRLYMLAILFLFSLASFAQYEVTLKVIDNEDGALTNKVDDNNETNVFLFASDLEDNKLYENGDWWYAMYSGEGHSPNGKLTKADGVWTWQATFNVGPGEYKWNPHMKTLGWKSINELYKYGESNDLYFTVSDKGEITGTTTLSLPLGSENSTYEVTLKVVDNQNGELTNKVDDNNETNVIVFASDLEDNKLYENGDWWYAMYSGESNSPTGELIKGDGVWTWQATFEVAPGEYKWNPHMKTLGWKPINEMYKYGESNDLFFEVSESGEITGTVTLELPIETGTSTSYNATPLIKIWSSAGIIKFAGVPEGAELKVLNLSGQIVHKKKAESSNDQILVSKPGIYLFSVNNKTFKTIVR